MKKCLINLIVLKLSSKSQKNHNGKNCLLTFLELNPTGPSQDLKVADVLYGRPSRAVLKIFDRIKHVLT